MKNYPRIKFLQNDKLSLIIFILLITIGKALSQSNNCSLKKIENGVEVYTCQPGSGKFNGVKAKFKVKSTISNYIDMLKDVSNYSKWKFNIKSSEIKEIINDDEFIFHMAIDSPWPVADRDVVMHLTLDRSQKNTLVVENIARPSYMPEIADHVRIPKSVSKLTAIQVSENELDIEFYVELDPGGEIPVWLVNMVSTSGPIQSFSKVRELLDNNSTL